MEVTSIHVVHTSSDNSVVVVRAADAETLGGSPQMIRLLADSTSTDGKLSTQRVTLQHGADGANPHHHSKSAELFYVLQGAVQLLAGERVLVANEGDLAIIPAGLSHAFAASPGKDADLLIVIAPGVERFEYFRHLVRIARGELPSASLLEVQERYDTYFEDSSTWRQARTIQGGAH